MDMTEPRAMALLTKIITLLKQNDQWFNVVYENKPALKCIKMEISIKVVPDRRV